jgi:hypothetical protein
VSTYKIGPLRIFFGEQILFRSEGEICAVVDACEYHDVFHLE